MTIQGNKGFPDCIHADKAKVLRKDTDGMLVIVNQVVKIGDIQLFP